MKNFHFGLESEYLILNTECIPLWHKNLSFKELYRMISNISLDSIPSLKGLDAEEAHDKILPYVVEGYHIKNMESVCTDMMPKGIEIRTPVCESLEKTIEVHDLLLSRLKESFLRNSLQLASLSHHPFEYEFDAPQINRRHDFWLWAKEVMTTYGPDINISFPEDIGRKLFENKEDFEKKLNFYAPLVTALSLNSPFYKGGLKYDLKGRVIKSIRTFRRSTVAPLIEWHENENYRVEFKFFEMTNSSTDLYNYFLICLGLVLCDDLKERALKQDGIYLMGEIASSGLETSFVRNSLAKIYEVIIPTLESYEFCTKSLRSFFLRSKTPADSLIQKYNSGKSIIEIVADKTLII